MEKDVGGEFIPVKLDKNGVPDKNSSCVSSEGMTLLRNYTYSKLMYHCTSECILFGFITYGYVDRLDVLISSSDIP